MGGMGCVNWKGIQSPNLVCGLKQDRENVSAAKDQEG